MAREGRAQAPPAGEAPAEAETPTDGSRSEPREAAPLPAAPTELAEPEAASPKDSQPPYGTSTWARPGADVPPSRRDSEGLFGPLRIGLVVGAGLPSLFSFGATIKLAGYFGAGLNVGMIPRVRISYYGDATLSYQEYDIYGRIYPFGKGFFLGAGVGYTFVEGTHRNTYDVSAHTALIPGAPTSLTTESKGRVRTLVLLPQLGYFHTFVSGFSAGLDLGFQIPIAPGQIEFDTQLSQDIPQALEDRYLGPNDQKVRDTLERIARTPIPTINFRLGWLL